MTQKPDFSLNGNRSLFDHQNELDLSSSSPLHLVIFSASIVSDWQNPAATTVRAVMRALIAERHEVVHLEERKNQATIDLLQARGSAGLRAFTERYADLPYRTYELPSGVERTVWFVRQVSTADAVIILDGTPTGVVELAAQLQTRHLTWIRWSSARQMEALWADIQLAPPESPPPDGPHPLPPLPSEGEGNGAGSANVLPSPSGGRRAGDEGGLAEFSQLGPAVERITEPIANHRTGMLLVAYDDQMIAESARDALRELGPVCLSAGSVEGDHWTFVPEVALTDHYRRARLAVVAGIGDDPFATARVWLPVAAGCPTVAVTSLDEVDGLRDRVVALTDPAPVSIGDLPNAFDATVAARRLVDLVRVAQHRRLPHLA